MWVRNFKRTAIVFILPIVFSLLLASACLAEILWDAEGVALYEHANLDEFPLIIPDGQGGAIVVWRHETSEFNKDILAQRIDASGKPLWGDDGMVVCDAEYSQQHPLIVSDGAGGAIIAWNDQRSGEYVQTYMQRIDASGNPCWAANGIAICDIDADYACSDLLADGAGGAIVAWTDNRSEDDSDIYAQRIDPSGNPMWTLNGIPICVAPESQYHCRMAPDGTGGVIFAWSDDRTYYGAFYAQKCDSDGVTQWKTGGVVVCDASWYKSSHEIITDGAGGAIIAWQDYRKGGSYGEKADIYAARIDASGNLKWNPEGAAVCTREYAQDYPRMIPDGEGGAIITWQHGSYGPIDTGIYAQRIDSSGSPLWNTDGIAVAATEGHCPDIVSNQGGGAIITFYAHQSDESRVYAQNISASGVPYWQSNGLMVCDSPGDQNGPVIATDGAGGCIIAWSDQRSGDWDIYAQRISGFIPVSTTYLAEGYTGAGFQEYICLGNPDPEPAIAVITYIFGDGTAQTGVAQIPPRSRTTVNVNQEVGEGREVSARIESDREIAVERAMYFTYGEGWTGGHDAPAASPSTTWYFAEGYTGAGFDEWICVLNPGFVPAALTFDFQTEEEGHMRREGFTVPAHSRATFKVNEVLGAGYQASLALTSDQPVVAERPIYFDYAGREDRHWTGGHCVTGATALASEYLFAEGTTRTGFDEWLTIQNPSLDSPLTVEAAYMPARGQGEVTARTYEVAAGTRHTVFVPDEVGREKDVAIELRSEAEFLAERPIYFDYSHAGISARGGHCVIGAAAPAAEWFLAEGFTGDGFDQWLCLLNPSDEEAVAEISYFTQEAGALEPRRVTVPPRSRVTVMCNEHAGAGYQLSCVIKAVSGPDLAVERPIYFDRDDWNGGHCSTGCAP